MASAPSSAGPALRQIRWPALPPVDLLNECHWLVTLDGKNARKPRQFEDDVRQRREHEIQAKELQRDTQRSPYRQELRRPKVAPPPGSPAQRAAKSILKLKEGLLCLEERKWLQEDDTTIAALAQQQHCERQLRSRLEACSTPKPTESSPTGSSRETSRVGNAGVNRAKTPQRRSNRKKHKHSPTREERDLAVKQARLAEWLKANPDKSSANSIQGEAKYSIEVGARIDSAMQCRAPLESGVGLWNDPVRSLLAAEITSESVFGGPVPTRALAFQTPQPPSPVRASEAAETDSSSPSKPATAIHDLKAPQLHGSAQDHSEVETTEEQFPVSSPTKPEMSDHAQKVFSMAHRQVADSAVADALATLEAGILQSLSTSQAHQDAANANSGLGFNYSVLAHANATKLQLCYRARHRCRIQKLLFLQQRWRYWHARRQVSRANQYEHKQAKVIQRRYRPWYTRITQERSAVRIQRCFRLYETQKYLIRFRQACRWLLARAVRRRRLKVRMRLVGRLVFAMLKRRRHIALVQGLWRGRGARAQLVALLSQVAVVERGRRRREDEFVAARLTQARLRFREFLTTTKRGRELVRWQQDKPWVRFRRLRRDAKQWEELPLPAKINAAARILPDRKFRGLQQRSLCQMLVGKTTKLPALPKQLIVSSEAFGFLAIPPATPKVSNRLGPITCCPWWGEMRQRVSCSFEKLSRRTAALWWKFVTWPKEYCSARIWPIRGRRRSQARQELEDDCVRVLDGFLCVWFRRMDNKTNAPPYACEWCAEPFSACREYFAHGKCAASRARAETEWTALSNDLEFVCQTKWRICKKPHEKPRRLSIRDVDLDAVSVRRLRRTRSRRKALRPLVATLEACTGSDGIQSETIPLALVAFLLQYLDDSKDSHVLMRTAEHQLVSWSKLVGSMEEQDARPTPGVSGLASRWIRKDELRSRLMVGSNPSTFLRWRRSLCRRGLRHRSQSIRTGKRIIFRLPRINTDSWQKWQQRLRGMTRLPDKRRGSMAELLAAQRSPTSPAAAGSRVLPVAT